MPIKVELHPDVEWFLRHRCNENEVDAFYERLEAIRTAPIQNSEALVDPKISQYVLRGFRFGVNIAAFEYDAAMNRIRVLVCRTSLPRKRGKQNRGDGGAA
ncbi:MAG: hypothetical protein V3W34_10695 [Phycisphaerae bacterium]